MDKRDIFLCIGLAGFLVLAIFFSVFLGNNVTKEVADYQQAIQHIGYAEGRVDQYVLDNNHFNCTEVMLIDPDIATCNGTAAVAVRPLPRNKTMNFELTYQAGTGVSYHAI